MTRKKHSESASAKNELIFAVELAKGSSVAQAARKVGVAKATGYRWSKKPEVCQAVEDFRRSVLQMACNRMINITGKAVETLGQLLDSKSEPIRLSAARAVLDGTVKVRELAGLEREIEQIHEIVATIRLHNKQRGPDRAY